MRVHFDPNYELLLHAETPAATGEICNCSAYLVFSRQQSAAAGVRATPHPHSAAPGGCEHCEVGWRSHSLVSTRVVPLVIDWTHPASRLPLCLVLRTLTATRGGEVVGGSGSGCLAPGVPARRLGRPYRLLYRQAWGPVRLKYGRPNCHPLPLARGWALRLDPGLRSIG